MPPPLPYLKKGRGGGIYFLNETSACEKKSIFGEYVPGDFLNETNHAKYKIQNFFKSLSSDLKVFWDKTEELENDYCLPPH